MLSSPIEAVADIDGSTIISNHLYEQCPHVLLCCRMVAPRRSGETDRTGRTRTRNNRKRGRGKSGNRTWQRSRRTKRRQRHQEEVAGRFGGRWQLDEGHRVGGLESTTMNFHKAALPLQAPSFDLAPRTDFINGCSCVAAAERLAHISHQLAILAPFCTTTQLLHN